ncbi:hypothetical protein ElyMa_001501000 [Elysia marginata]|uniref:Uncharacterized protein n=1 Tax=Elysia marginata TaxID=1093978 RepID=A0AAV4J5I1_9GAST|nr:hypothetical protein ElyMa_001501000 [Elysia marginata]
MLETFGGTSEVKPNKNIALPPMVFAPLTGPQHIDKVPLVYDQCPLHWRVFVVIILRRDLVDCESISDRTLFVIHRYATIDNARLHDFETSILSRDEKVQSVEVRRPAKVMATVFWDAKGVVLLEYTLLQVSVAMLPNTAALLTASEMQFVAKDRDSS